MDSFDQRNESLFAFDKITSQFINDGSLSIISQSVQIGANRFLSIRRKAQ
jgi:hypothetical protein